MISILSKAAKTELFRRRTEGGNLQGGSCLLYTRLPIFSLGAAGSSLLLGSALRAARGVHLAAVALKQVKKNINNALLIIPVLIAQLCVYPALCQEPKPLSRRPEHLILTPLNRLYQEGFVRLKRNEKRVSV